MGYDGDNLCRINANTYTKEAKNARGDFAIEAYHNALRCYIEVKEKNSDDARAIGHIYDGMAIIFFNRAQYDSAATYYSKAIEQLSSLSSNVLVDTDYRELTDRYIDLSDAFLHLCKQDAALSAFLNAQNSFSFIKEKTLEERDIGDPFNNAQLFHAFYEKLRSHDGYLNSSDFKNNQFFLFEKHNNHEFLTKFDQISIDQEALQIEKMMAGLVVANQEKHSVFIPVVVNQDVSDAEYRRVAIGFLRLTQSHVKTGTIQDTIKTYEQANSALLQIKEKKESDLNTIKMINEQIKCLLSSVSQTQKEKVHANLPSNQQIVVQNQQTSDSLIATIGIFSSNNQNSGGSIEEDDEEMNMDMDMDMDF